MAALDSYGEPAWSPSPPIAPPASVPTHAFAFTGSGVAFFALVAKNMLLTLLTLGIFLPWAKTERRKYLWQNIEIAGHRLRYHGTGKELLVGYAKVVVAYLVFIGVSATAIKVLGPTLGFVVQVGLGIAVLALVPFAIWGSRRYLLSRTSYRGVRFGLERDAKPFAKLFFGGYLLTLLTLGIYAPIWMNRMHRMQLEATSIGTRAFVYRGADRVVFRMAIKYFLLSFVTFGLSLFWYQAALARYQIENTWLDGAHGKLELEGGELFSLFLLQLFATTLSLGLAFPWVATYTMRFYLARMTMVGPIDFARIYRAESSGDATADGLADALDVGIAL